MHLLSRQVDFEQPLRREAIQHGIVHHRLLYVMMQQAEHYVFLLHSVPIQERHWIRKTPLLRSMEAINTQALRLLRLFGNKPQRK